MTTEFLTPRNAIFLRFIAFSVICGVVTFLLGKDSNWDIFNYHLYAPHAFWTQDLQTDFMAAGPQRYLNPIGYLPFYWMIQAGWHSLVIAVVLAMFHGFALLILWEICARFIFQGDSHPGSLASLSVALAALSPVFLGMLGGSYLDPPMLVFVLGGLLLLCVALDRPSPTFLLTFIAGGLLGIAAALKLTNAIFAASAGIAILFAMRFNAVGWKTAIWYGAGTTMGALLAGGWWSFLLYREFGNPFFPLFNEYFQSPDFPAVKLSLVRFIPASIEDALSFPFNIASSRKWIYVERGAADIRFALLVMFALSILAARFVVRTRTHSMPKRIRNVPVEFIILFFVASCPLWLATSGNGRYALPILLIVGPILIFAVRATFRSRSWFLGVTLAILTAQGAVFSLGESPRWDVGAWTDKWIDVEVPVKLKENPYGYLSVGNNSNSFVALNIHPESRLSSMLGVFPISLDGSGGKRLRSFMSAHAGKLRTLEQYEIPIERSLAGKTDFSDYVKAIDARFAMWDLQVDPTDCEQIKFSVRPENFAILVSCGLRNGNPRRAGLLPEWERATRVMEQIERACPVIFNPSGGYTTPLGGAWYRHYPNTDTRLRIVNGRALYSRDRFGPFGVDMGSLEDWEKGRSKWICAVPPPHWKLVSTP